MVNIGGPRGDAEVAVVVNATRVISVQRLVQRALPDGRALEPDVTPGVMMPSRHWMFPEGYAGLTYNEYLTLFNPGSRAARIVVRFAPQGDGGPRPRPVTLLVPARGQGLLDVGAAYRGARVKSVGLMLDSTEPVVSARTLYWGAGSRAGQFGVDAKPGLALPSARW